VGLDYSQLLLKTIFKNSPSNDAIVRYIDQKRENNDGKNKLAGIQFSTFCIVAKFV